MNCRCCGLATSLIRNKIHNFTHCSKASIYLNQFRVKFDCQFKPLKSSVLKCCYDILIINMLVMYNKFVFEISVEFSIVSSGTWLRPYDCVKCLTLTFQSQNSSKVNGVLIVPFLSAFYQGLVTFFFVCMFLFYLFFFLCVFLLEEDKWQI